MKQSLTILSLFFYSLIYCQSHPQVNIVTLDPFSTTIDSASAVELVKLDSLTRKNTEKEMFGFGTNKVKESVLDSIFQAFKNRMPFLSTVTLGISRDMNLFLFGKGGNIFSYPTHDTSDGSLQSLTEIAKRYHPDWIINPRHIQIETIGDLTRVKINIQVFNVQMNKIVSDLSLEANSEKLEPYLKCQEKTLECCIADILVRGSVFIMTPIGQHHKYL